MIHMGVSCIAGNIVYLDLCGDYMGISYIITAKLYVYVVSCMYISQL